MATSKFSHLSDPALLHRLKVVVSRDCGTTAELIALIAEVDARKLYLPAGYPSMHAYCVGELHLSEDAAFRRIRAARLARQFPVIYDAVSEGRLHLSGLALLAPYLSPETSSELLAAAEHKTRAEIEVLLAERFPRPDLTTCVMQLAPGRVAPDAAGRESTPTSSQLSTGTAEQDGPKHDAASLPRDTQLAPGRVAKVIPIAPQRFGLQVTMDQETHDLLRYAQDLLGHQAPSGDIAQLLNRALKALIQQLEKRKFATTTRPRSKGHRPATGKRTVPAHVKRAVWARDAGRCTFVSDTGRRCPAHKCLEFDHVQEVARGGEASVAGMRLRCRAHNQYEAERTFGAGFMEQKREEARRATEVRRVEEAMRAAEVRRAAEGQRAEEARRRAAAAEHAREIAPWLKRLGFHEDEIRRAAAASETPPDATLEERVRLALSHLGFARR